MGCNMGQHLDDLEGYKDILNHIPSGWWYTYPSETY